MKRIEYVYLCEPFVSTDMTVIQKKVNELVDAVNRINDFFSIPKGCTALGQARMHYIEYKNATYKIADEVATYIKELEKALEEAETCKKP